jgi:hypothetical protein
MEIPATIIVNNQPITVTVTVTLPEQYRNLGCRSISQPTFICEPDLTQHIPNTDQVYLINAVGTNRYKIGHTTRHPTERIRELQTGNPDDLVLIGVCPGGNKYERMFHKMFQSNKIRGEWFEFTSEKVSLIKSMMVTFRLDFDTSEEVVPATSEEIMLDEQNSPPASPERMSPPASPEQSSPNSSECLTVTSSEVPLFLDAGEFNGVKKFRSHSNWKSLPSILDSQESPDRILAAALPLLDGPLFKANFTKLNDLFRQCETYNDSAKMILANINVYKYNQEFLKEILSRVDIDTCIREIFDDLERFKTLESTQAKIRQNIYRMVTKFNLTVNPAIMSNLSSSE